MHTKLTAPFWAVSFLIFPFIFNGSQSHLFKQHKPQGYAILVGIRHVDNDILHKKFDVPDSVVFPDLDGPATDVNHVYNILRQEGFRDKNIIRLGGTFSPTVTAQEIVQAFSTIAGNIKDDDLFIFYYSGHGHQVADKSGDEKIDKQDEVLVTSNGFLLDDKINEMYRKSFMKTRNIMMMDACHAGTLHTITNMNFFTNINKGAAPFGCNINGVLLADENVNMIYLGASNDQNEAHETGAGGYFTLALAKVYNPFTWHKLSPEDAACMISKRMINDQDPGQGQIQFSFCGQLSPDFKNSYLFKIQ